MGVDRIIMIGPTESVLTSRGNRFPDMAAHFIAEGCDVHYITSDFYHAEKRFFRQHEIRSSAAELPYRLTVLSVIGYRRNISVRRVLSNLLFSLRVFLTLLQIARRGDVIIIPSRPVELIFLVSLVRRFRPVRTILDVQDIWPDALSIPDGVRRRLFSAYCWLFLKPSVKAFDEIMLVTHGFRNWVNRYAPGARCTFIPLGWERSRWGRGGRCAKAAERIRNIGCVAQLQHQIDVTPILDVLRMDPSLNLTLIGEDGSGERYPEVVDYLARHGIKSVTMVGVVARDEVKSHLHKCDVGILPMISSSLPNKIFDYLGAGLPIVVLGDNDSSRFVNENGIGWSCPFSGAALRELLGSIGAKELQEKADNVSAIRDLYCRDKLHCEISGLVKG